jgi:hypothetical protein
MNSVDFYITIIIALFALVIVAAFIVFRQRGKVTIKGPLDTEVDIDASNEPTPPTPAVTIDNAKSKAGGLLAEDNTGRGANVRNVEVSVLPKWISQKNSIG